MNDKNLGPGANTKVRRLPKKARYDAETIEVVARGTRLHHFDRAASQTEGHRPQRPGTRPVD